MSDYIFIYKTNGFYLGFIRNGSLYSRDGIYIGWTDGNFAWDTVGRFRGTITTFKNYKYILMNRLTMPSAPRIPKTPSPPEVPPAPQDNIAPINLPPEFRDGFNGS